MAYAVIELLPLNFALNPLFCKTDVTCWPSFVHFLYFYFFERWQNFKTTFFNGKGKLFKHFLLALCGCQNA